MSNILNCEVCKPVVLDPKTGEYKIADYNSCSVAAAYKARWGWERQVNKENENVEFDELVGRLKKELEVSERKEVEKIRSGSGNGNEREDSESLEKVKNGVLIVARPDAARAKIYEGIVEEWKSLEDKARQGK